MTAYQAELLYRITLALEVLAKEAEKNNEKLDRIAEAVERITSVSAGQWSHPV